MAPPQAAPQEQPFVFPDGILGFPCCRQFALTAADSQGLFWLQALDCEPLAFLLMDPFEFVDGFYLDLDEAELARLDAERASEIAVLAIVTLPREPGETPTANLQGPIILNFRRRIARQVVLSHSPYGVRCPVDIQRLLRKAS